MMRAQGLALLFASVLRTGSATTIRGLPAPWRRSIGRWLAASVSSGLLDDLCHIPSRLCRLRPRRRRRARDGDADRGDRGTPDRALSYPHRVGVRRCLALRIYPASQCLPNGEQLSLTWLAKLELVSRGLAKN